MAKAIFKVLFKIIKGIAELFLAPVNLLIANLFPDFANMINIFNTAVSRLIGGGLAYFSSILPPNTRSMISLYLIVLISYYTIMISFHLIMKVITILKNLKVW